MKTLKLTVKQQSNRVNKWLKLATTTDITDGVQWYGDAHKWAAGLGDVATIAQITSILSAQCDWNGNKKNVANFLAGQHASIFASGRQLTECANALEGWTIPENRSKTFRFAATIADPTRSDIVVIDRHAIKIAFDQLDSKEICITDKRYRDAEQAYQDVAQKHGLLGHQVQAICWTTYKRIVNR